MQMPDMFTQFKASYLQLVRGGRITKRVLADWGRSLPVAAPHAYAFSVSGGGGQTLCARPRRLSEAAHGGLPG